MSDLKVSACFSLPLKAVTERVYSDEYETDILDSYGDVVLPCVPDDVDANAIVSAINSHDKLRAENEALREALSHSVSIMCSLRKCYEEDNGLFRETSMAIGKYNKLLSKDGE